MATTIRVSHTFPDGHVDRWEQDGDTEANLKRRRTPPRKGPGWAEWDGTLSDGTPYVERVEWVKP